MQDRALKLELINRKINSLEESIDHWMSCIGRATTEKEKKDLRYIYERDAQQLYKWREVKSKFERALIEEIENEIGSSLS